MRGSDSERQEQHGGGAGHLDLLQLDAVRAGEADAAEAAHAAACDECRRAVNRLTAFAEDLARSAATQIPVPVNVDEAVLTLARRSAGILPAVSAASRRREVGEGRMPSIQPARCRRYGMPWVWVAAAAAAALVVAVGLWQPWQVAVRPPAPSLAARQAGLPGDLNGDGTVDILDAFFLARRIERREALDPAWDVTGDGKVDEADVQAVAGRAVAIGGRQG